MSNRAVLLTIVISLLSLPLVSQNRSDGSPINDQNFGSMSAAAISTAYMAGSVNTLDGRPLDQARIELHDLNTGAVMGHTYSRSNGSFELYNIPKGSYEVVATKGVVESRERVDLAMDNTNVNLKMSNPVNEVGETGATVSVSQYKVPSKARKEFEKAQEAFNNGKMDEAKSRANKAVELYPNFAEALTLRGILEINAKENEQGQADLQKAIQLDPNYGVAYFAMGAALNQAGKFDDAVRTLERGVSIKPDGWQGFFELAKATLANSDFKAALKNATTAEKLSNDAYAPIHVVKAHALMGLKQYGPAVAELQRYLDREPQGDIAASARRTLDQAKSFVAAGPSARATTASGTN
jgi:tetratricopeptide (TPR) repeat protein